MCKTGTVQNNKKRGSSSRKEHIGLLRPPCVCRLSSLVMSAAYRRVSGNSRVTRLSRLFYLKRTCPPFRAFRCSSKNLGNFPEGKLLCTMILKGRVRGDFSAGSTANAVTCTFVLAAATSHISFSTAVGDGTQRPFSRRRVLRQISSATAATVFGHPFTDLRDNERRAQARERVTI